MKIKVHYSDETIEEFDTFSDPQKGIEETVLGCDFAATVIHIGIYKDDEQILPLECTWSVNIQVPDLRRIM